MQKAIDLAIKISKQLDKNWLAELEENDLHKTFQSVFTINENISNCNRIVCFIIYAYSPESLWLDLKKDRLENKTRILNNLDADINLKIFEEILCNNNEAIGISIFEYLELLKSWKWRAIFDLLDYSAKMSRFASQETESEKSFDKLNKAGEVKKITEEIDVDVLVKVNKEKGALLDQSIAKRKQADALLDEIRKEFVVSDHATQADFNFQLTDTSKRKDILSWRAFIKDRNMEKQSTL